jgi:hypothetical protein
MPRDCARICLLLVAALGAVLGLASAALFCWVGAVACATQVGDYFRLCLLLMVVFGSGFALASTAVFALRLHQAHPDLWQSYRNLFWSWPDQERSSALRTEVYTKISDGCTRTILAIHKVGCVMYIVLVVVAGLLFLLTLAHL